jgi:hypothetical protein
MTEPRFLAVGFSLQHLWFHPEGQPKAADVVIQSGASRRALRCGQCSCLVIPPARRPQYRDVRD